MFMPTATQNYRKERRRSTSKRRRVSQGRLVQLSEELIQKIRKLNVYFNLNLYYTPQS